MSGAPVSGDAGWVDPTIVQTLSELVHAFQLLRGTRSYTELGKAVNPTHGRGPRVLPRSTLNNLLHGKSVPTRDTVIRFLAACGLDEQAQVPWLAAWERANTEHLRRPPGAVRVREARPRLLGVHASIQIEGAIGELPGYVRRDLDVALRTVISAAAEHGGFVLLVGGSSVGKTRTLLEAVRAVLPEWWLIHPADSNAVGDFARTPTPRTVLWLDELQRYLDDPRRLQAGIVRNLVAAGVVVAGTLWPHEYASRIVAPLPGQHDPYANDRQLLGLAEVMDVPENFSDAERSRAETLASDARIRVALNTANVGITQVLAAGPELIRRWENAPEDQCYGKAVITAALDARRVGAHTALSRGLLAAAAPAYLTSAQQANAPSAWLDHAEFPPLSWSFLIMV